MITKVELRAISKEVDPTSFVEARAYLGAVYQALKTRFEKYSYVQFTIDLGFGNCNAMYLIINGQRPLTLKGAQKIVTALDLRGVNRRYFLSLVKAQSRASAGQMDDTLDEMVELKAVSLPTDLSREQLAFYQHWYHAAILELLSLPAASDDPAWISSRLMPTVPPLKVKASLALLTKLGLIGFDEAKKRLVPQQANVSTGAEVYGLAVLRYHHQMIGLAQDSLTGIDPRERDISAVTIAMPANKRDELKTILQELRQRLLALSANAENADEILQINLQLFPIGRLNPRSKRHDH